MINDKRRIKLENIIKKDYIPPYEGRPKRDIRINDEDVLNLKIVLNTSNDIKEFIKNV